LATKIIKREKEKAEKEKKRHKNAAESDFGISLRGV